MCSAGERSGPVASEYVNIDCLFVSGDRHDGAVTNLHLASGSIWRLHNGGEEIARLTVTGTDMPWVHAEVETLPGFQAFLSVFADQEQAALDNDWERADACYTRIRSALTMTFPDGSPVAEFWLHIQDDGMASWRWHDEPFDTAAGSEVAP